MNRQASVYLGIGLVTVGLWACKLRVAESDVKAQVTDSEAMPAPGKKKVNFCARGKNPDGTPDTSKYEVTFDFGTGWLEIRGASFSYRGFGAVLVSSSYGDPDNMYIQLAYGAQKFDLHAANMGNGIVEGLNLDVTVNDGQLQSVDADPARRGEVQVASYGQCG